MRKKFVACRTSILALQHWIRYHTASHLRIISPTRSPALYRPLEALLSCLHSAIGRHSDPHRQTHSHQSQELCAMAEATVQRQWALTLPSIRRRGTSGIRSRHANFQATQVHLYQNRSPHHPLHFIVEEQYLEGGVANSTDITLCPCSVKYRVSAEEEVAPPCYGSVPTPTNPAGGGTASDTKQVAHEQRRGWLCSGCYKKNTLPCHLGGIAVGARQKPSRCATRTPRRSSRTIEKRLSFSTIKTQARRD